MQNHNSMRHWRAYPLLCALVLALAACKPEPTAHSLMLDSSRFAAIASIETVLEAGTDQQQTSAADAQQLRQLGIHSFGRYRYHLRAPDGGVYKVHILLFTDTASAVQHWQQRHHAEALATTRPLPLGEKLDTQGEAWIYPNAERGEMASLRIGRAVIEIRARGAATVLAPFSRAIAAHTARVLRH